jgi:hypothetical protein
MPVLGIVTRARALKPGSQPRVSAIACANSDTMSDVLGGGSAKALNTVIAKISPPA